MDEFTTEQKIAIAIMSASGRTRAQAEEMARREPEAAQWIGEQMRPAVEQAAKRVSEWFMEHRELFEDVMEMQERAVVAEAEHITERGF